MNPSIRFQIYEENLTGFEIAILIPVAKIIGLNFVIQNKNCLGKNLFTKAGYIYRKGLFVDAKDYKANMAQDKVFSFCFISSLRFSYEASFFCER